MIINRAVLHNQGCHDKDWIVTQLCYETIMGSHAYGCEVAESDVDIYGFCIPPKEYILPSMFGFIPGFSRDLPNFEQFQATKFKYKQREAEGTIFSIVKYFRLVANNNPNMLDSLFTRPQLQTHRTKIAEMVIANKKLFVSKRCWDTFVNYAYSQRKKLLTKVPEGKRVASVEKYGYDVKFAAHSVRLLNEVEQLLVDGDMDLMRHNDMLKSIRRGEWPKEKIIEYFDNNEKRLQLLCDQSPLPEKVDERKLKHLLINCLEEFYGDLRIEKNANVGDIINDMQLALTNAQETLNRWKSGGDNDETITENDSVPE